MIKTIDLTTYRYERKYVINKMDRYDIELILKTHPSFFSEIYHARYVNNIYFDEINFKNYFDNIRGISKRSKFRIRWYGDLFGQVRNSFLEIKIKKGPLGTKKRYALKDFTLDNNYNIKNIQELFSDLEKEEDLKFHLAKLRPVLLNRYHRKYFQTADKDYRVTIDTEMEFHKIDHFSNSFLHQNKDYTNTVIELKYNMDKNDSAMRVSDNLPFVLTKNSKYVNGINLLYPEFER